MAKTSECKKLFVAAIDFGTTYSGYAFSSKAEWIKVNTPTWAGGNMMSFKAPSALLLNADKSFNSFGYDAEKNYTDLAGEQNHKDHYYFHRFKMNLNKDKIHRNIQIEDVSGKLLDAMVVFSHCICHLKEEVMKTLNKSLAVDIAIDEVQFVLTVPAIWNDTAKMFMREAAIKAGIKSDHLIMALEPEAASIFCQHQHLERDEKESSFTKDVKEGLKYMVVDLGGGTADITVHQRLSDGTLEELIPASGGPWGGTSVDRNFQKFIHDIVGEEVMATFTEDHMEDYLQLMADFETKKRSIDVKKEGNIHMTVPFALLEILKKNYKTKNKNECMKKVFEKSKSQHKDVVSFENNKIKMPASVFKELFHPTCENIVQHIQKLYTENNFDDVNIILMVGGFSESSIVYDAINKVFGPDAAGEKFGGKRIIVPGESGLAVLKGAVYFGHIPNAISRRVSRYTYGIQSYPDFNPAKHDASKKMIINGHPRCKDVFFPYVKRGDRIKPGMRHSQVFQALNPKEKKLECAIYISEIANPKYIDETHCRRLGILAIELPTRKEGEIMELDEIMIFGETELRVKARDIFKGTEREVTFDLLDEKMYSGN